MKEIKVCAENLGREVTEDTLLAALETLGDAQRAEDLKAAIAAEGQDFMRGFRAGASVAVDLLMGTMEAIKQERGNGACTPVRYVV